MKHLTIIAIAAIGAMAYADTSDEADSAAIQLAEAQEKMAAARARMAEAAKEMAAAAKLRWQQPDRAFLGVLIADEDQSGIKIAGISPDSGAAEAGLEAADVIVAINDESLLGDDRPLKVLHGVLEGVEPGESVRLMILRDGAEQTVEVTTTPYLAQSGLHHFRWWDALDDVDVDIDLPSFAIDARSLRQPRRDGLRLADIGEDLGDYFGVDAGVLVLDTPAQSELKPGDILKRIDGAAVSSTQDAYRLLRRLEQDAPAEVRRKNRKVTVNVAAASARMRLRTGPRAGNVMFIESDEEVHEEQEEEHH